MPAVPLTICPPRRLAKPLSAVARLVGAAQLLPCKYHDHGNDNADDDDDGDEGNDNADDDDDGDDVNDNDDDDNDANGDDITYAVSQVGALLCLPLKLADA